MIVVVDHQDSFVFNLVQQVQTAGFEVRMVPSTAGPEEVLEGSPQAVILSPGPGAPEAAGCFIELIRQMPETVPVLGVCLGHQALATAFGGRVGRAPEPVHGKVSPIIHQGAGILAGLPSPFAAGRYHSLVVASDGLPPALEVTATTADGLVMGLRHRSRPWFGVQFHPESVLTPEGGQLMDNFLSLARTRAPQAGLT
ncbi:MAG: aminodeoxychorismate/anthranilate synthase component II [Candidatus Dormiibacterota bacterium]